MFKRPPKSDDKIVRFADAHKRAKAKANSARTPAKEPFFNFGTIPLLTKILFWALLAVHIVLTFGFDSGLRFSTLYNFGFVPEIYTHPENYNWRMIIAPFSSLLLHSGWMHVFFNMIMLFMMGIYYERRYGLARFGLCLLLCGLAGNFFYLILSPSESLPVVGLSGAINGVFAGVFLSLYERGMMAPILQGRGPWPFVAVWLVIILLSGFLSADVSWQSHMGGFLAGLALHQRWSRKGA